MRDERGPWYLLTGFVLGAVLGLFFAWVVSPVEYVDASPSSLRAEFKDQYRALIAAAYVANGDLARAQARLNLLADNDMARTLAEQAQRTLAEGGSPDVAQALALLALDFGQGPTPVVTSEIPADLPVASPSPSPSFMLSPTVATPGPTSSPTAISEVSEPPPAAGTSTSTPEKTRTSMATATPLPTRTPTTTPDDPFVLHEHTFICDQSLSEPLIQVVTEDAAGEQVAGVEVIVSWEGGEDHFFTGLKPEKGPGYADFTMLPGEVYTLRLADGGQRVPDLTAAECEADDGSRYWGSWYLLFAQPES